VYNDGNVEHAQLLKQVFELYAYSNPLHPDVFPGCRKMEAETIRMVADLYNGGPDTCGTMSNGGTESILLACLAYRNRAHRLGIREPEMIVPVTAHAAFDKAAFYFGIRIRHIRIDSNHRVNIKAMKSAIGCSTCMLVASAPNYPTGTIDPVEEVARLGKTYGIPVHVDACLGGFLIPFMDDAGYSLEPFDFRLPGVTSISCDTHKYGFAPKGTSVVMYRDKSYLHDQYFCVTDWPGGIYATPTLAGSRSGCNIAMTWATLMCTGREGYVEKTRQIVSATKAIRAGLEHIPGIVPLGVSEVSVVAFTSDSFNIYAMSDKLHSRHWNLNTLQKPASIHLCLTANHIIPNVTREFLTDVREIAMELSNDPDASAKSNTAAIYGMAASVPDPSLVEDVAKMFIDICYEASPSSV